MARTPVRILLVLVVLAVIAVASSAFGIIGTGSAQTERPGTPLPDVSWKVTEISATEVSTGRSTGGPPFVWGTGLSAIPRNGEAESGAFCVFVSGDGPLWKSPGGALFGGSGGESGGSECGPMNPKTGLVETDPIHGGSMKQPQLGTTETWQTFDVGIVAYPPSVDRVRLRFAGGGSTVLPLRRLPTAVRPSNWEPFRYASFGVYGCVGDVEGLTGRGVMARVHQSECGDQ
jgi:hypothetical protein